MGLELLHVILPVIVLKIWQLSKSLVSVLFLGFIYHHGMNCDLEMLCFVEVGPAWQWDERGCAVCERQLPGLHVIPGNNPCCLSRPVERKSEMHSNQNLKSQTSLNIKFWITIWFHLHFNVYLITKHLWVSICHKLLADHFAYLIIVSTLWLQQGPRSRVFRYHIETHSSGHL